MDSISIRVLHLSHTSVVSGAEHSLLTLIAALPSAVEAGIACPEGDLARRVRACGVAVHPLPAVHVSLRLSARVMPRGLWELVRAAVALRRISIHAGATVIHANSVRAGLVAMLTRALGGPPFVVHVRDVLPAGLAARTLRRLIRRHARVVVALSEYGAERFTDANSTGARVEVIDNPVDLDRFRFQPEARPALRRELRIPADVPLLGIVGQITSWKGHDTLIRALPLLPRAQADACLLIVGEVKFADATTRLDNHAFRARLEDEIVAAALEDRVVFAGERDDIPTVLSALDVLLAPSLEEPFGRTVAEAMVIGTPVVATTVGGPAEMIEQGVTGRLAPPGEPAEWARQIAAVLDDPAGSRAMTELAQQVARERFDAKLHAARMLTVLGGSNDG